MIYTLEKLFLNPRRNIKVTSQGEKCKEFWALCAVNWGFSDRTMKCNIKVEFCGLFSQVVF